MQVLKYLKQYRIPFSGLVSGKHKFDFDIDDKFFDCFEHSLVKKGKLKAEVALQKQENMLIVIFEITGTIKLTCDICLAEFDSPLDFKERVLVKFTEEDWDSETEEVITLSKTDYEFDVATLLYEYINVRVPYYSRCVEQGINITCDPEMLAKISSDDTTESNEESKIDPRWDILKKIKNN
ncbi:MAG: YceD family protein [Sphingobacterium sp.]